MTDDRRAGGAPPTGRPPTADLLAAGVVAALVAIAAAVALSLAIGFAGLPRVAATTHGPAGPPSLSGLPPVDVVVGSVYLLVGVGVIGHLVRERSPHVPDPGDRLF